MRRGKKWRVMLLGLVGGLAMTFLIVRPATAIFLDDGNTIQLTGVFYNQVRLRTEEPRGLNTHVGDYTLLQHRYFVDPQLQVEALTWIERLPFGDLLTETLQVDGARFFFNPRFEYDGIFDYGQDAFRDDLRPFDQQLNRFQLFEVYGNLTFFNGRFNLKAGRQNLSWGETNIFRLLDRVNPLDNGFGGFLIPLDERRRPLVMVRGTWGIGDFSRLGIYNAALEAFIAPDRRLPQGAKARAPFGVQGGPLTPTLAPTFFETTAETGPPVGNQPDRPDISLAGSRWGVRLLWTWQDISFTAAYMQTYPDGPTPSLELGQGDKKNEPVIKLRFPRIHIAGFTASGPVSTFQVPLLRDLTYTIFRTEIAGFFNEPFFIEKENFALGKRIPKRNVIRGVVGIDHNAWIRSINPFNTFFFTAQQFFSDIQGSTEGIKTPLVMTRDDGQSLNRFVDVDRQNYVTTITANTLFSAGYFFNLAQIQPQVTYLYDWEGAWLFQPQLNFIRDPFRFRIEWNWLDGRQTGIGLLQDKDNLAFRIDYLL